MNEPLLRTMSGQIVTRIRDKILSGDYAPGSALLQDSIAAEFGVSKIPVREALVRLRAEGLIDIEAHRGFRVRPLLASEVDEVFRLRLALEPAAVGEGAKRCVRSVRRWPLPHSTTSAISTARSTWHSSCRTGSQSPAKS